MVNFGSRQAFQPEARRSFRIGERLPVTWRIKDESANGIGKILNISETGMMLAADASVLPSANSVLAFQPTLQNAGSYLPLAGRLVWSKKRGLGSGHFLWGIEFVEPAQDIIANLHEKIKAKIARVQNIEQAKNVVGAILVVGMVISAGFILTQQTAIQQEYEQSTHLLLGTSAKQASLYVEVSDDLKETKIVLAQTESLLAQAREQNAALQNDLQIANANLQSLTEENGRLFREVDALKERLRPFEAEVGNLSEGKSFIIAVRNRLREIKVGIRSVNRQARQARIAAQKERDKILLAQGNQGYFIRDSKPINATFPAAQPEKKIKINVDLFE